MSMEDKILDDDDIIDLTDLLEEGESSKKGASPKDQRARHSTQLNEPDSFDLGKEISMEYDVSVEEIDHGGENLDINGSLSSSEEVALTQEKELKEVKEEKGEPVLDELEVKELDFSAEDLTREPPVPPVEEAPPAKDAGLDLLDVNYAQTPDGEKRTLPEPGLQGLEAVDGKAEPLSFDEVSELAKEPEAEEPLEKAAEMEPVEASPVEEAAAPAPPVLETPAEKPESGMEIEFDRRALDDGPAVAPKVSAEDVAVEVRLQMPALIEAIVKPLMEDLVKDMVAASREMLPGILEKVIREEIEKLKKLDS